MHSPSPQRGSVIFYILIAIVAFASLSFAVSRGSRESATTIDREKSDLGATEIFDFVNALRGAIQNMTIQGVQQPQLCFDNPSYSGGTFLQASCATAKNKVFAPTGGNAPSPRQLTLTLLDQSRSGMANFGLWYFPNSIGVSGVGQDCTNPECNELVTTVAPLNKSVCVAVNKKMGVATPETIPVNTTPIALTPYVGSFAYNSVVDAAALNGKRTGCVQNTTGENIFYAVLIAN